MAKTLPNINKPVPEAGDAVNIKVVSDAIEEIDNILGAKPATLATTAKTLVGAINALFSDIGYTKVSVGAGAGIAYKLHSGILICRHQLYVSANVATGVWTFPVVFDGSPLVVATNVYANTAKVIWSHPGASTTSVTMYPRYYDGSIPDVQVGCDILAVGVWK